MSSEMGGALEDDRVRIAREQRIRPEPPSSSPETDEPAAPTPRPPSGEPTTPER